MITEIAYIRIDPVRARDFEAAVARAEPAFRAAEGCHGVTLERIIETPGEYRLRVGWDTVDHHMVKFRGSEGFKLWRAEVGPFFLETPRVEHSETALRLTL